MNIGKEKITSVFSLDGLKNLELVRVFRTETGYMINNQNHSLPSLQRNGNQKNIPIIIMTKRTQFGGVSKKSHIKK